MEHPSFGLHLISSLQTTGIYPFYMAPSIASIACFTLFIGATVTGVRAAICESPSIRREWRALSVYERAEWIEAVNVR